MKNEKWKAQNKFVRFVQFVVKKKQTYSLPFREGSGVDFFPSPSEHSERLTSTKHTAWGGDDEGEGKQCARGG